MFYLLNKELSFNVDLSFAVGCGMDTSLYLIAMESDGGRASQCHTRAINGTGYCCDVQLAKQDRPYCEEIDFCEANSLATVHATHPCQNW